MSHTAKTIKPWWLVLTVVLVLLADQGLKYWVKTSFFPGQEQNVLGNWFKLNFVENNGMAFGLDLGGGYGKLLLTFFRIVAVAGICGYIVYQYRQGAHKGFLICLVLIMAGALGNIIDSVFYGVWFAHINHYTEGWFHGQVVDMFHFDILHTRYPAWFPIKGGEPLVLFRHVFNIADAAISIGVISILVFQGRFIKKPTQENIPATVSLN